MCSRRYRGFYVRHREPLLFLSWVLDVRSLVALSESRRAAPLHAKRSLALLDRPDAGCFGSATTRVGAVQPSSSPAHQCPSRQMCTSTGSGRATAAARCASCCCSSSRCPPSGRWGCVDLSARGWVCRQQGPARAASGAAFQPGQGGVQGVARLTGVWDLQLAPRRAHLAYPCCMGT